MLYFSFLLWTPLIIALYIPVALKLHKQKAPIESYIVYAVFYFYIAKVIAEVFFPIPIDKTDILMYLKYPGVEYNLIPFKSIISYFSVHKLDTVQFYGNILLLIPLGYLLPLIKTSLNKLRNVLITAFCISFGIEIIQLIASFMYGFTYKYFDVDDIIMNVFGAFLGFMLLKLTFPILKKYTGVKLPEL
jgi:glycopeptide antibiotics resistance protein